MFDKPFQFDRPVFCKEPIKLYGHQYKAGDHFPWKELGFPTDKAQVLYREKKIYHNANLEKEVKVGDGLELMNIDALHGLVDEINKKVKSVTKSKTEFDARKVKKSQIADKQRGLIRSWRRRPENGELEAL